MAAREGKTSKKRSPSPQSDVVGRELLSFSAFLRRHRETLIFIIPRVGTTLMVIFVVLMGFYCYHFTKDQLGGLAVAVGGEGFRIIVGTSAEARWHSLLMGVQMLGVIFSAWLLFAAALVISLVGERVPRWLSANS